MKALIAALMFVCASGVWAQALKGVSEIQIVIEHLDDDARYKCQVTKDAVYAAVRLPLSNTRIRVTNSELAPYIYVQVTLGEANSNHCYGGVFLEFKKFARSEKDVGGFWSKNSILISSKLNVPKRVSEDIELFTKQFIAEWLKQNPN